MIDIGKELTLTTDTNESFYCKVHDINDESVYIDYPIHKETRKTSFFLDGTEFKISYVGKDGAVYQFESEVVSRKKMTIPVLVLTYPGEEFLTRIQRRRYVRVEASVDVAIKTKKTAYHTVSLDVSGGGALLVKPAHCTLIEGQLVQLTIVLPMNSGVYHYIESEASIVRTTEKNKQKPATVSVKFEGLAEKNRQHIIKYGFEQQRSMKKREYS
ncbi:flagellar brake protein [Salimicrobium flavidum]|uniref:C-di-GMP-binding flagellar brake protein YcgR, contains PilZNR and PilZ domains n=1 Tax=Salimicrobium flavidum TaxID=570947 RepID=A0A1N7IJC5_9BACI|nr:flagellar brake domain-containing protein [Salimicrobium flavidum]SIS37096.1 c-di-GMP-binding flagellar brake protein YcgR, contains PilZNR and PilZ domains [Salimicrobium flavidum]